MRSGLSKRAILAMSIVVMLCFVMCRIEPVNSSYDIQQIIVDGQKWILYKSNPEKVIVMLFGGQLLTDGSWAIIGEGGATEKDFISKLTSDFSVVTNNGTFLYGTKDEKLNHLFLCLRNQSYNYISLFGYSAGGSVVGYHIINCTTCDSAIICAGVVSVNYSVKEYDLINSADFSADISIPVCFIAPISDNTTYGGVTIYEGMQTYFNNMKVAKEWHDWSGGHNVFDNNESETSRNLGEVILAWLNMTIVPEFSKLPNLFLILLVMSLSLISNRRRLSRKIKRF